MPVVNPADLSKKGFTPIVAFACLHILGAEGGSQKYVSVQMTTGCDIKDASGVGTFFGAVSPPALAE